MGLRGARTLEPVSEERQVDVAVVGGGPAGMAAALAASLDGASVTLIDEYAAPGRTDLAAAVRRGRRGRAGSLPRSGRDLCAALAESDVTVLSGATVWAAPEPGLLLLTGSVASLRAGAVVLATGAYDRPVAFPGWTLPGVMTAGGAQALAKGQDVIPGRRVLLAGAGPFLLPGRRAAVRARRRGRRRGGDAPARLAARGPADARAPRPAGRLRHYRTRVRRIVWGHVIVRADGDDRVRSATIAPAGPDWAPTGAERTFEVDAVCTAYGFTPSVELARALGCELADDAVAHDEDMRTSVPGVFVAGEATGIGGADLALVEGELAGHAAAARGTRRDLGALRRRRAKLAGFAQILADLFDPRPGLLGLAEAGHRAVPLRGRHRRRDRRGRRRRRDDGVRAEDRHALRPGAVPGARVRAARLRAAAGARALQRPGSDPADPARRPYGFVVDSVNVSVLE